MFKTIGTKENIKETNKINGIFGTLKNIPKNIKDSFTGITWPDKERVKKEFITVLVASVVITLVLFGISSGNAFLLKLFF